MSDRLKRFIHEIHRRSLWQVLGIYLVASWVVLQVVETLEGMVTLPEWFAGLAIGLLVVGLPIVLATAFVQEGGPGREAEDEEVGVPAAPPGGASGLFTWRNAFGGGVLAFALLGFVGTGWLLFGGGLSTRPAPASIEQSVAVLPFVNMSADPDNEYFSDGITEELLNAVAQIPGLRVPARTSSFSFKGRDIPVGEIAEALGVAHILEGSVRRDGDRVLITAQLVDARTGGVVWSDRFARELDDIFAIQRQIATAIANQLRITLSEGEEATLVTQRPVDPGAYDSYLKGRYEMVRFRRAAMGRAIEHFQESIRVDPGYAPAHAALSIAYTLFSQPLGGMANLEGLPLARAAAERALDLDTQLSEAHVGLGMVHFIYDRDWEAAEQEFRRAVDLDPNSARGRIYLGLFFCGYGTLQRGDSRVGEGGRAGPPVAGYSGHCGGGVWACACVRACHRGVANHPGTRSWLRPRPDLAATGIRSGRTVRRGYRGLRGRSTP